MQAKLSTLKSPHKGPFHRRLRLSLNFDVRRYTLVHTPQTADVCITVHLDVLVWELRRYCQVLNVFGKVLPAGEQKRLDDAKSELLQSSSNPTHKFRLSGGLLEKILESKSHPSRPALLWNNPAFGLRKRTTVRAKHLLHAQNPLLYLYPEMLEELLNYVFIPEKLVEGYRAHLANINANPTARP